MEDEADMLADRVARTMLSREGTGSSWAIEIEEAREGYSRIRMTLRPDMMNAHASAHGGMIFALADTAFAYACNSRNSIAVAQQASIHFLSPARIGEVLIAEASECATNGRTGSYMVTVSTDDGRAVAEFQGLSREIGGSFLNFED